LTYLLTQVTIKQCQQQKQLQKTDNSYLRHHIS
jgi:hypothetical protein